MSPILLLFIFFCKYSDSIHALIHANQLPYAWPPIPMGYFQQMVGLRKPTWKPKRLAQTLYDSEHHRFYLGRGICINNLSGLVPTARNFTILKNNYYEHFRTQENARPTDQSKAPCLPPLIASRRGRTIILLASVTTVRGPTFATNLFQYSIARAEEKFNILPRSKTRRGCGVGVNIMSVQ